MEKSKQTDIRSEIVKISPIIIIPLSIILLVLDRLPLDLAVFFGAISIFLSLFAYEFDKKVIKSLTNDYVIIFTLSRKFLKITKFLFSPKTHQEIFEPIAADWQEEYFEALFKKETWKARWINVRYTYAFLAAMWMKSPIGSLIEFVIKIAKP